MGDSSDSKPELDVMEIDSSKTNGEQKPEPSEPEALRKLFIGGLTLETDEDKLKEFYSQWGDILDVVVMRDPGSKKSRGFGFISFAESSSVDDAMRNRPHKIDGKQVDPKRAVPRDKSGNPEAQISVKKLFVSGIREDHTEEQLKEYFTTHGEVESAEIMKEKESGKIRGFAFVLFKDFDSVDKCCLIRSHEVGGYRCDVKKALSREEMRKLDQKNRDKDSRNGRSFRGGGGYGGRGGVGGGWNGGRGGGAGGYGYDVGYGTGQWQGGGWSGGGGGYQEQGSWGGGRGAASRGWGSNLWR